MRIVRLFLLGLFVYVISVIALFPVAPVVEHFRERIPPMVQIDGVSGKLYHGEVASVRYTDDLLPLEFEQVGWTLAPQALLKGGTGATVRFEGYGGSGEGLVLRQWDGDIAVSDFRVNALAKALEPLLPVPIARFNGELLAEIDTLILENQLLTELDGKLRWVDAALEAPVQAALGNIVLDIEKNSAETHLVTVTASGGDVDVEGTVGLTLSGDFNADLVFTPTSTASADVVNNLRRIARAEAGGRFRLQQNGNVNRLM